MKKKILALLFAIMMLTGLSACGEETQPTVSSDGSMLYLSMEDIETEGMSGFFVMNEDGSFTPVMSHAKGYSEPSDNLKVLSHRYLWFHDNDMKISELIPTIKADSKLVFIYNDEEDFPGNYTLEKYAFKGYTIGCHIYKAEDNSLHLSMDRLLGGSSAQKALGDVGGETYRISKINGSNELPVKNIDNNIQMLLGLEEGKYYAFEFFKGTKYLKIKTIADTFVFQSEALNTLQNPYTRTEDGYFYVNLPDNLQKGYYYICGEGLFRYDG